MYRNYASLGRGTNQNLLDSSSGSGSGSSSANQKYSVAGSSQFVPSLNAITSSQDLQWLVQPSLLPTPGPSRAPCHPYPLPPRTGSMNPHQPQSHLLRPGVIRPLAVTASGSSARRRIDDHETDQLEDEKSHLQKEIAELQKEKEKLELVLEAHRPILKPKPKITIPAPPSTSVAGGAGMVSSESESLHTPVLVSTPSLTPFTASLVFTYPLSRNPEPCGIAHRRSSSSGDQSDQSLNSPTILTL
uniref:Uncharacterized protein n=1 Tax=Electrophorus electricus TaxID=8005 RepID=A0A4W4H1K4_ELEEL